MNHLDIIFFYLKNLIILYYFISFHFIFNFHCLFIFLNLLTMYSKPVYLRWSRSEPEDIGVVIEFGWIDTLFGWIDAFLLLTMASLSKLESSRMLRPLLRLFESRSSRCFEGFSTMMSSENEKLCTLDSGIDVPPGINVAPPLLKIFTTKF